MRPLTLLALLPLLLALVSAQLVPRHGDKTIYDRGDSGLPFNSQKDFFMADGQCKGIIQGGRLPCDKSLRLRVTAQFDPVPPRVTISDMLNHAEITRVGSCRGLFNVKVESSCFL